MLKRFGFGVVALCALAAPAQGVAQVVPAAAPQTTAAATQTPAKETRIGTLLDVEGPVTVTPAGGQAQAAANNMPIYLNDTVNTGDNARAFVLFIDNTNIVLSADTNLKIDKYVYDPDDDTSANNNATYSIQGAFEYVSGLIGHRANPDVHVETPVGAIGIRGTDFWAGPDSGQYSVAVNEGQVSLKTDGGEQLVDKGEGTTVRSRFSRPAMAQRWSQQRFQRLAATVRLQHYQSAIRNLRAIQSRQPEFRQRYTSYVRQSHPHWWHHVDHDRHQDRRQDNRQDHRQNRRGRDGRRDRRSGDNGSDSRGFGRSGRDRFERQRSGDNQDGRARRGFEQAQARLDSNEHNANTQAWRQRWQAWQKQNATRNMQQRSPFAQDQNKRWQEWQSAHPRQAGQQGQQDGQRDQHDRRGRFGRDHKCRDGGKCRLARGGHEDREERRGFRR